MRPSVEVKVERVGAVVTRTLVGLLLMAVGFGFDFLEYKEPAPTHTTHLVMWTILALAGVALLPTIFDVLFPRVQKVFILVFPNGVPMLGGKRAGDPPAPPSGGAS